MEGYTEVFAWGGDHFGQLGLGNKYSGKTYAYPRFCSFNILIKDIACGEEHSSFISQSGHVYCMGSNSDGRLGLGDRSLRQSSSPCLVEGLLNYRCIKISCGWGHTAVITEEGNVFSWGVGEFGALGSGGTENAWSPVKALLPKTMRGLELSCGSRHTGLIVEENRNKLLLMTGSGEAGQLGTGKREKEFSYVIINFQDDLQQVACGVFHTLILGTTGKVYAMGGNSFGQLGLGNKKSCSRPERIQLEAFIIKVACGSHSAAVSDKGQLYVWGSGVFGEYLQPTRLSVPGCKDVSIGGSYGIAVDMSGGVFAWGANTNGELGIGDYDPRIAPTFVPSLKGKSTRKISCGGNYVLGLGLDLFGEGGKRDLSPIEEYDSRQLKKEGIEKAKVDERIRTVHEKMRNSSMDDRTRYTELESRARDNERTRFSDVDNKVAKPSEKYRKNDFDVKNNNLDRSRYSDLDAKTIEKRPSEEKKYQGRDSDLDFKAKENPRPDPSRSSEKYEIQRLEQNYEDLKITTEYTIKDLQLSNSHLKQALEESQRQNSALSLEFKTTKEELLRYKRIIEEIKQSSRIEVSQRLEELNQSLHSKYISEVNDIKLIQEQEAIRKRQLEKNLEISSKHISNVEEALGKANNDIMMLKSQLDKSISTYEVTKNSLQLEIEKFYKENTELEGKYEWACNDIKDLKSQNNKFSNENQDLLIKIDRLNKENKELQLKNDRMYQENKNLQDQINDFYQDNREMKNQVDFTHKQSNEYQSQIESLSFELKEAKSKYEVLYKEKTELQIQYEKTQRDNNELHRRYEGVSLEKDRMDDLIKNEIDNSTKQEQELADVKSQLVFSRQANEDFKFQLARLQQQIAEYVHTIEKKCNEITEWEKNYKILLEDNSMLKESVDDLESKNKQLFYNLEKELSQRAKEYKERTIQILNTPNRSTSPYLRPSSPLVHHRDRSEVVGNTAIKLLEAMDSPKSVRTSQYMTIPQAYKGSTTPTKEDVRTRIASLMKNRMRIEEQIQNLNQD
ncbi:hypothetical protein SteCoe_13307 [Stentor coeruleus]|uniref:RCC1-like domain-containing protein n=1 Tax=Stentor coeruleus TaxID=5963 RepID=A0A1R2C4M0_9CILI|nr:hypothetical protein SteCoe_15019 [Stentor coeruleus]OMJ85397.1 hypothetical protein SteCoe_13307 [Stentor coeruleus]